MLICPTTEAECFLCEGWTAQIMLELQVNFLSAVIPGRPKGEPGIHPTAGHVAKWIPGLRLQRIPE
jgi:hypothetical protein